MRVTGISTDHSRTGSFVSDNGPGPNLGRSAASGALVTLGSQGLRIGLQFISIITLARILTPEQFGLVAMVTAIIGIAEVFRDFGLSMAAVQAPTLSRGQRDNLFWVNTLIGLILTGVTAALAPAIALLYGEPDLVPITQALSITFFLNGLSTQYRADLTRRLQFLKLNSAEIVGQGMGLAAGIAVGLLGWGFWALVVQQVVQAALAAVLLVSVARWVPGPYSRKESIRSFFGYGMNLLGVYALAYGAKNLSGVIIGANLGAAQLGAYNRAYQLLTLPLAQLNAPSTRVALPVLSRVQSEPLRFDAFLIRGQSMLLHAVLAVFSVSAALASPLVAIVLGPQWGSVVPIFQILAIAGVAESAAYAAYWVFLARGLTRQHLYYAMVMRPLQIGLVIAGAPFGLYGVVWGYTIGLVIAWPASLLYLRILRAAPVGRMARSVGAITIAYVLAAAVTYGVWTLTTGLSVWAQAAIGIGTMALSMVLVCAIWPHFRSDVFAIVRLVKRAIIGKFKR